MKKLLSVFMLTAVLGLFSVNTFAAEPPLHAGSKSLFFTFNGLSELSIDDYSIGGQYLFANRMGVWGDIGFGFKSVKPNKDAEESTGSRIGLNAGFIMYPFQKGPVACYVSPQLGIYMTGAETPQGSSKIKDNTTELFIGVSIGGEWWFAENISLSCSGYLGFTSMNVTREEGASKMEASSSEFGILGSPHGGKFILSFYF